MLSQADPGGGSIKGIRPSQHTKQTKAVELQLLT